MPELPEVTNVIMSLEDIKGHMIKGCNISLDKLIKKPDTSLNFFNNVVGLTIKTLERKGKYIIIKMDQNYTLIVHLGMTGLLTHVNNISEINPKYLNHLHVKMELNDGSLLCYCDIRRFGSLRLLDSTQMLTFKPLQNIGPEPFDIGVESIFINTVRQKKWSNKTIKEILMNQNVIAGVGNIYACESLYWTGIDPNKIVSSISDKDLIMLLENIKTMLLISIEMGGSSVNDYMNGKGQQGSYQTRLKIYQKDKCPQGHNVESQVIKGRNTFYCPICQK